MPPSVTSVFWHLQAKFLFYLTICYDKKAGLKHDVKNFKLSFYLANYYLSNSNVLGGSAVGYRLHSVVMRLTVVQVY